MARPTKSATTSTGKVSKNEKEKRIEEENRLKGGKVSLKPSKNLTPNQSKIFKYIVKGLKETGILGCLDIFVLERASCCIDTIIKCEELINKQGLFDTEGNPNPTLKIKKDEMAIFFRVANELSLSPQARAKIANINLQALRDSEDELLKMLRG